MAQEQKIEIISNQENRSKPLFKTEKEYQDFRQRYADTVRPLLEEAQLRQLRSLENTQDKVYRS
jgi:uncharacterized membrane-anchored protein YhcB (DUF1043 family)